MIAYIYDRVTDEFMGTANLKPECGEDFCENCGDCLSCYGSDPCYETRPGHSWVIYINEEWWSDAD